MNKKDETRDFENELVTISRLALAHKEPDLRMYLAKLIRKLRSENRDLANKLEEQLKSKPERSTNPLRDSSQTDFVHSNRNDVSPLLKQENSSVQIDQPFLPDDVKSSLISLVEERQSISLLAKNNLSPTSSVIFQGPPGIGKTLSAHWLASKLNLPLYTLDLTTVMSSYLGRTGSNLRSVIDFAKTHSCILFLDEIDAIAKKRSDEADVGELKRLVTIMLQELENWPTEGLLIAATNHPELVDPALWRRFDLEITFSLPNQEQVNEAVSHFLENSSKKLKGWQPVLSLILRGHSYSDIKRAILQLKRWSILKPKDLDEIVIRFLGDKLNTLSKKEKIELGTELVNSIGISQLKTSKLLHISRDTLRKYLSK